ncbi:MAG TPA: M64 family metallopeptidase [Polyangia bacterium]|nr:M64 family metallopeptidase [Polyangia bacterium]
MTLRGPQRALLPVLAAALLAAGPARAQHSLEMLQESGPQSNRVDLVVLGDGYTADEQELFAADVDDALENLLANTPYAEYRPLFNIARIDTASAESGADHPSDDFYVDTWFGCAFDCFGIERLICCDSGAIFAAAAATYPGYDVLMLLVNDPEYGGSGGPVAVSSTNAWALDGPGHEFGHTFAALGDEYEDPYPDFVFSDIYPNVSPSADADLLKWMHWVEDATPLPTPDSAAVDEHHPLGAYEGACYQPTGLYRPAPLCLMRSLGETLCPVCAEAMVLAFWSGVEPFDSFEPEEPEQAGVAGDVLEFSVEPVRPEPDTMVVRWLVDGLAIPGAQADILDLEIADLEPGVHQVTALVEDATDLVIADDEDLLTSSVTWTVTRTDEGTDTDSSGDEGAGGSGGGGCGCAETGVRTRAGPVGIVSFLTVLPRGKKGG